MKRTIFFLFGILFSINIPAQDRYAVLINEIMPDPSPSAGLPEVEWIELKNVSPLPVNLKNWRIGDSNGLSGPFPDHLLHPGDIIIVCTNSSVAQLATFGTVVPLAGFPSLDNNGESLYLQNNHGSIIHSIEYSTNWYGNKLKEAGGWSLELIDPANPCNSNNWKASIHPPGGTPGQINSVNGINTDADGPVLENIYLLNPSEIILRFNETLDSSSAIPVSNFTLSQGTVISVICEPPLFKTLRLKISVPFEPSEIRTISVNSVKDCSSNFISGNNNRKIGMPGYPQAADIIINEILFDPRPSGYDYAELYNPGNKIIDASKLHIAGRNSSGDISNIKAVSAVPFYVFPGEYLVLTENPASLSLQYHVKDASRVLQLSLPSLPDDKGNLVVLNEQGEIIEELRYHHDWHFKLISNKEGVALERLKPNADTNMPGNWHSASSTAGYGTPGYKNSQIIDTESSGIFSFSPPVISPDNDGRDDVLTIIYEMQSPGTMVTITIFDASGRVVKNLVRNELAGSKGHWNWDGVGERGMRLPSGMYVVHAEMFDLQGKRRSIKKPLVITSK